MRNGAIAAAASTARKLVDEIPATHPAFSIAVATTDDISLLHVRGKADMELGTQATIDTPFYIASQTKSYVGLVAAELDGTGIMPLRTTLRDVWPELSLPAPADAARINLFDLLTHQLPILNDPLVVRTSYEADVPSRDYPQLLAGSEVRTPGFRYDNLGYLIYAAALETVTGETWRTWLERLLFIPLGLSRTSTRTSPFGPGGVVQRHLWAKDAWQSTPPKCDALMHAAGGMVTSPRDAAAWMQANLRCAAPTIDRAAFLAARERIVAAKQDDGPFSWEHYGLGLQIGTIAGIDVVGCRGGYEGARSLTVLASKEQVGLTLMVGADFQTRTLLDGIALAFFSKLGS